MRNLKRVLSLAMAAAMLIGMMVVSAGAVSTYEDFTDKDEIQNTEAVNTMVSLGVINGKDDGSYFDPAGIVTRAEMAALIARCLNGGIDPSLGTGAATTTFTDTKGHWAEAYIAYCANLGIINGKGDGTFGPDETVTGTAAAKMFLCALGYRSEIEGLTGAGWDLNTDSLANKVGLYDGLTTIRPSDGLNRDNTAQLIYNGVQANEVEYRNNYGEYSGVIYPQPNGTVLTNRFRVVKVEGVVAANDVFGIDYSAHGSSGTAAAAKDGWTRMVDCNGYTTGNTTTYYDGVYPVAMGNELVGQRVVIYVKFQNALSPNASNSIVVGEPIVSNKTTVVETAAKLKDEDAVRGALRSSGLTIPTAGDQVEYVIDETGISKTASASNNDGIFTLTDDGGTTVKAYALPGVVQRFIDNNGDGVVDIIFQEIAAISKVSSYNTKDNKLTLSNIGSKDFDDIANYEDVAKDDYVLVTKYGDTYYLDPVETVEGEVTAYNSGAKTLTVDGTAYAVSFGYKDHNKITSDLGVELNPSALSGMVGNSYTLYMDKSGNIIAAAVLEEGVGNYAVVTASGAESDMMGGLAGKVKLILADGTTGTYNVDLLASAKKFTGGAAKTTNSDKESWMADRLENVSGTGTFTDGAGNGLKNTIVTYVLNDDGSVVLGEPAKTVTPPATQKYYLAEGTAANVDEFVNSVSTYKLGGYNMVADNNTVFFFLDRNGSYSVTTGLNNISSRGVDVKTTDGNGAVKIVGYGTTSTKAAKAVFAEIEATSYTSTASYALITGKFTKTTENGDTVYTYPVVFEDGTEGTLKTKLTEEYADNTVYAYKQDSKGFVTEFNAADTYVVNNVYVSDRGSNTVTLNNLENYTQFTESYPFASGWKGWNVEDTSDIFDVDAAKYDVVAAVLNDSKAIRTLFVVDTIDEEELGNQTAALGTPALAVSGGDLADGVWTNANGNLNFTFTAGAGQTVNAAVTGEDPVENYVSGTALYTVDGDTKDGDVLNVTITVKEADKTDRVYRYTVTIALAPTADITIQYEDDGSDGTTNTAAEAEGVYPVNVDNGTEEVVLTLSNTTGQTIAVTGADKAAVTVPSAAATMKLTVNTDSIKANGGSKSFNIVVSEAGKKSVTYPVVVTVAGAVATTYSVTYSAGGTGSTTQMPAKVEGLAADATHTVSNVVPALADNTFVGWLSNEGTPALYKDGDTVTLNGADVTLTAVFVADDVGVTDAAESGGLAAAGFKFTFTSDISALITKVAAQGSGTNAGSIADEANAGTGTTEFVPTFDDSTDLSSCTSGDSFEFVITLNGGVTPVTLTYTYA